MFKKQKITPTAYYIFFLSVLKIFFGFYLAHTNPDFFFTPDSSEYIDAANSMCKTGKFNDINDYPEIKRLPGLSFFLMPAACFKIDLTNYIIFLNMFMLLLSAYFTFKIIKLININISILFVFLIFLLDPTLTRYQYNILSEIIFLFFFTSSIYSLIYGFKKTNLYYLFLGFFLITSATFIRPLVLYLPYFLFGCLILFYFFSPNFRSKFNYLFLFVSFLGLLVHFSLTKIWIERNYKLSGVREFTYIKSINSYYYLNAGIVAKSENKKFENVREELRIKSNNLSKTDFINFSKSELKKNIFKFPFETMIVGLEGAIMIFITPGTGQYSRMFNIDEKKYQLMNYIFNTIGFIWILIMGIFTIFGFIKINKNIFSLILILFFIYLLIVSSGPMSYSRFRIPFIPILSVFIALGIEIFLKFIKKFK